jgi:hypothetical protein
MNVYENKMLSILFGPRTKGVTGDGENYIGLIFITYTFH